MQLLGAEGLVSGLEILSLALWLQVPARQKYVKPWPAGLCLEASGVQVHDTYSGV